MDLSLIRFSFVSFRYTFYFSIFVPLLYLEVTR